MAADYVVAVCVRYALLLAASGIARQWVLPEPWADAIAAGILAYALMVIHTEPAARYARGMREPWYGWMALGALCGHALGAMAVYALIPLVDLRYEASITGGMEFRKLWWVDERSLLEVGGGVAIYAVIAAAWAVAIGAVSRAVWGAREPEEPLVRVGSRPRGAS